MYSKGKSHKVCQDYAAHRDKDYNSMVSISDGCSSSKDTDIGARIIVIQDLEGKEINWPSMYYGKKPFTREMFDATLLSVKTYESSTYFDTCGDGVVAYRETNGNIAIYRVVYPCGYPKYMSYTWDEFRMNLLSESQRYSYVEQYLVSDTGSFLITDNGCIPSRIDTAMIGCAAVFTDGVESFTDKEGNKIEAVDIVTELMAFKSTQGEFVTRRMSRFLKDCEKRGWSHYDDLSMAAIVVDR
jgi:hypothetical protein